LHSARNSRNIGLVVSQLNLSFQSLTAIEKCIRWVIDKTFSAENVQLLFLCATLGYIVPVKEKYSLPLPEDETTKQAFDKLLQNLANCAKRNFRIPENCLYLLKKSAYTLVQGSSNPGWLTFAAYFRHFFGMQYVLSVKMEPCKYKKEDFFKLISLLVVTVPSIRKVNRDEGFFFMPFLKRILQFATDDDVLFQMFQNPDVRRFFPSQREREYFFFEFYKDCLNSKTGNLGEKLEHLNRLPENFRGKMSGLIYGYVQQFIDNVAEPSPKDMDAVFHLISESLSDERFYYLLGHLSKSSSASHHDLFFQLINDKRFTKLSTSEKVKICNSWVKMKTLCSAENIGRIKGTFEAVDILLACTHISSNNKLIQHLCENAFNCLLREEPIRLIEEFIKEIENYSAHVQNCFQELVEDTLHRLPYLVTKKEVLSNLCGNTR
jgi:hypothetical protein